MKVFNKFLFETDEIIKGYKREPLVQSGAVWPIKEKNPFLMNKDMACELGGYPKESVNLIISSERAADGLCCVIGDPGVINRYDHVSFGKIVIVETDVADAEAYDFAQAMLMADSKLYFEDLMLRTSSARYETNFKISKTAMDKGFNLDTMAFTIRDIFMSVPGVKNADVILIIGDSDIYKKLLPVAEQVKDTTVALNHIFDGIEMDCSKCDFVEICDEVDGLKELHLKQKKQLG